MRILLVFPAGRNTDESADTSANCISLLLFGGPQESPEKWETKSDNEDTAVCDVSDIIKTWK